MSFQIILLPQRDYWSWVRACKEYVLTFGANLTPDPNTAAGYMAPRQVVTIARLADGYPAQGDIVAWFHSQHPGIRLDVIEAENAQALEEELGQRVRDQDRYGQLRRPFVLQWPTDYPVVTQRFGANPRIYARYGMPGHEGLDIRALTNTNIYACADGTVYEVHTDPRDHAYGIHIRIQHRDGYKTIYAHLARALVDVGDGVQAGQIIAKADSTGNSSAAHLHMSLKRDGATERGETNYPKDILDPTPFMIWPEGAARPAAHGLAWAAGKCLVGAHARIGAPMSEADVALVSAARLEALCIWQHERRETIERLRSLHPALLLASRLTSDFAGAAVGAEEFVAQVDPDLGRLFRLGIRHFEVHASPNLQTEGWQRSWQGGREFAGWYRGVLESLRRLYPEAKFGFPGLSPGESVSGQRGDALQFLQDADDAAQAADWIGVCCYWTDDSELNGLRGGRMVEEYRLRYPDRLLFVTEFGNPAADVSRAEKGRQYVEYYRALRNRPGIGAAFGFALSSPAGYTSLAWRAETGGESEIAGAIAGRAF